METRVAYAAFIILAAWTCGCSGSPVESTGKTAFFIGTGFRRAGELGPARATTMIQLRSVRCFLWSNTTTQPSSTPDSLHKCSGPHPVSEGEPVAWKCETEDSLTFTHITIDSKPYELAKGRLFLLSRKGGELKVLQLRTGPTKSTGSGANEEAELEKGHPERQFAKPEFPEPHAGFKRRSMTFTIAT